jgi:hypothetical protein
MLPEDGQELRPKHVGTISNRNIVQTFGINVIYVIYLHGKLNFIYSLYLQYWPGWDLNSHNINFVFYFLAYEYYNRVYARFIFRHTKLKTK